MHRTAVLILATICAVGAVYFLTREAGDESDLDLQSMARRQTLRKMNAEAQSQHEKTNLDILARQGRGQAVPPHLSTSIHQLENYWFVGMQNNELRVQIPFEPGKLPHPPSTASPLNPNPGFLGADSCKSCHQDKYKSFIETAHYRTSRVATAENITGSFDSMHNQLRTGSSDVFFTMVQRDGDCFQRVSFFDWEFEVPFHLIMGSSKMGESYLYWHGDRLFQMNCTYLTDADKWINSPGFVDGDAAYARPIFAGCIDCHTTYVDLRQAPNHFTPSSLILGVSCERCHGPGKEHVDFHQANPTEKTARYVAVPSNLSRQDQMDVCGQCHTANKRMNDRTPFQFRPGDRLEDHYDMLQDADTASNRVHTSNQVARLALSKCFKQSEMGCVECHNPHQNERGQAALFSQRCLKCHAQEHCGFSEDLGQPLSDNCVDCHMPRRSGNLHADTAEGRIFPPLRDHFIRVDGQATREFLARRRATDELPEAAP
jgi:hypothetical protein